MSSKRKEVLNLIIVYLIAIILCQLIINFEIIPDSFISDEFYQKYDGINSKDTIDEMIRINVIGKWTQSAITPFALAFDFFIVMAAFSFFKNIFMPKISLERSEIILIGLQSFSFVIISYLIKTIYFLLIHNYTLDQVMYYTPGTLADIIPGEVSLLSAMSVYTIGFCLCFAYLIFSKTKNYKFGLISFIASLTPYVIFTIIGL